MRLFWQTDHRRGRRPAHPCSFAAQMSLLERNGSRVLARSGLSHIWLQCGPSLQGVPAQIRVSGRLWPMFPRLWRRLSGFGNLCRRLSALTRRSMYRNDRPEAASRGMPPPRIATQTRQGHPARERRKDDKIRYGRRAPSRVPGQHRTRTVAKRVGAHQGTQDRAVDAGLRRGRLCPPGRHEDSERGVRLAALAPSCRRRAARSGAPADGNPRLVSRAPGAPPRERCGTDDHHRAARDSRWRVVAFCSPNAKVFGTECPRIRCSSHRIQSTAALHRRAAVREHERRQGSRSTSPTGSPRNCSTLWPRSTSCRWPRAPHPSISKARTLISVRSRTSSTSARSSKAASGAPRTPSASPRS